MSLSVSGIFPPSLKVVSTLFSLVYKKVAMGGPGVLVTPFLQAFFNQTTYNRWQKCHEDILASF